MPRLLLIDDDEHLGAPLAAYFRRFQFDLQHATRPSEGLKRLRGGGFDVAILDVQLRDGKQVWPIADRLAEAGTPFVIATGGHVEPPPAQHADAPVLNKPYTIEAIEPALSRACGT